MPRPKMDPALDGQPIFFRPTPEIREWIEEKAETENRTLSNTVMTILLQVYQRATEKKPSNGSRRQNSAGGAGDQKAV